ncbi:hypothetical protein B0H11DRAFT_8493 [Mycena galericulata]|nr:hypothetical protein B0H11DRAFT_8493 [Mycena galericulata]
MWTNGATDTIDMASFDPDTTLGAYEIGVLASYALLGVTTTQTYVYYSRFPNDPLRIKCLVAGIWSCEVAHAVCIAKSLYVMTVSDYGHPEKLFLIPRTLAAAVLFSGIIGAGVQVFFASRIYSVSRSFFIPCLSWCLSFLRLLGSITACVYGFRMQTIPGFETQWAWLLKSLWSVASANDVIIAVTLVYLLHHQRSTADKRTVAIVDKLVAWTIETGVVTGAAGLVSLVCFVTMPENFVWLGCFVVAARLYSNSLLASLNSRAGLRAMTEHTQIWSGPLVSRLQICALDLPV